MKHIIRTTSDIQSLVEDDLGIDLTPDGKITRTASQELKRMDQKGQFKDLPEDFNFSQEERNYHTQGELDLHVS